MVNEFTWVYGSFVEEIEFQKIENGLLNICMYNSYVSRNIIFILISIKIWFKLISLVHHNQWTTDIYEGE